MQDSVDGERLKVIKTAKIEIVSFKDLKIGDYILWCNFRCKIIELIPEIRALQFEDYEKSVITIPKYSKFYRILDYEHAILCNYCLHNEVEKEGDYCQECPTEEGGR